MTEWAVQLLTDHTLVQLIIECLGEAIEMNEMVATLGSTVFLSTKDELRPYGTC